MIHEPDGVRILPGKTDILVIAPHGPIIDGKFQNDIRTSIIAEEIHRRLGCYTIVNRRYFKPKGEIKKSREDYFLDLFRVDHSRKVLGYTDRIKEVANESGKTLVLWVHGISDDFAVSQAKDHIKWGVFEKEPEALRALIGYGQGGDPKTGDMQDRFTAKQKTVESLRDLLTSGGINTILTHKEGTNYRGRDSKRFNQWFIKEGYSFDAIESIQLETRELGLRDSDETAARTGEIIANALTKLVRK